MDTERLLRSLKENKEDFLKNKILIRQYTVEADFHPFVRGASFAGVWKNRIKGKFGDTAVSFPSLDDMIKMKRAAGRAKDREDLKYLEKLRAKIKKRKAP